MPFLPESKLYYQICADGLQVVRPLQKPPHPHWESGAALPPSYMAYGRLRALATLQYARQLLHPSSRILEVAAGDAALSACLAEDGHSVTANDLLSHQLLEALTHFRTGDKVRVWPGNVFELAPGETFDLVIACEVIEHVAHPDELLRQLGRFLAPSGALLITTPNGLYFRNRLPTFSQIDDPSQLEAGQFKPDADGHLFLLTPAELAQLGAKVGLRVESIQVWGTPPITGESGFRHLAPLLPLPLCYGIERAAQRLPRALLERFANSFAAVLRKA